MNARSSSNCDLSTTIFGEGNVTVTPSKIAVNIADIFSVYLLGFFFLSFSTSEGNFSPERFLPLASRTLYIAFLNSGSNSVYVLTKSCIKVHQMRWYLAIFLAKNRLYVTNERANSGSLI